MPGVGATDETQRVACDGLALLKKRLRGYAAVLTEAEGDPLAEQMVRDLLPASVPAENVGGPPGGSVSESGEE
jgi:hypothetical protein